MFLTKKNKENHHDSNNGKGGKFNVPASKLPFQGYEEKDFCDSIQWRIFRIMAEFVEGFEFINKFKKSVTFFGSARLEKEDPYYRKAQGIANILARKGFAVVSGGGPGIMEAANRGAKEADGKSIGLNIQLPTEQRINPFVTQSRAFRYFFARKVMLSYAAEAYLYFPGGFGTLDEFFEILTLIQTHKIAKVPIILVGSEFWKPLDKLIRNFLLNKFHTIDPEDLNLYSIMDDSKEIISVIKKTPIREFALKDNMN